MATINAAGDIQLEPEDILPREVSRRPDDPAEVIKLIELLNPQIVTAEDLAKAVRAVDALRVSLASPENKKNPYIHTGS